MPMEVFDPDLGFFAPSPGGSHLSLPVQHLPPGLCYPSSCPRNTSLSMSSPHLSSTFLAAHLQQGLRFISALPSIPLGALEQEPAAPRTFHVTSGAFLG